MADQDIIAASSTMTALIDGHQIMTCAATSATMVAVERLRGGDGHTATLSAAAL